MDKQKFLQTDIFELLGLQNASQENKEELVKSVQEYLQARILERINSMLPEEYKIDSTDEDSLDQIIAEKLEEQDTTLQEIASQEAAKVKKELITKANNLIN